MKKAYAEMKRAYAEMKKAYPPKKDLMSEDVLNWRGTKKTSVRHTDCRRHI
jgi:hypothetical protein